MSDWSVEENVGNVTTHTVESLTASTKYDIEVRWSDGVTYGSWTRTQATTLSYDYDWSLGLAALNVEPYNYYTTDGTGAIITREVSLDGTGGTVESDVLTAYLISANAITGAKISVAGTDTGVSWLFSDDNITFTEELIIGALEAETVTTVYIKVEVDNDGSVSGNQQSAKIQIYRKI